jgi:AraC-like DNA-binding protein
MYYNGALRLWYNRTRRGGAAYEKGVTPFEAALRTGFSDQSHFTNYFSRLIGLAPGVYREIFIDKDGEKFHE